MEKGILVFLPLSALLKDIMLADWLAVPLLLCHFSEWTGPSLVALLQYLGPQDLFMD